MYLSTPATPICSLVFWYQYAPYTFNRLGEAVRMFFSRNRVTIIICINGILVLADTSEDYIKNGQFVIDNLIKLGFHIKREKCILGYSQDDVSATRRESGDHQGALQGCVISSKPLVPLTRARYMGIQDMVLKHHKGTAASAKKQVCLTSWTREEVNWWLNLSIKECHMSLTLSETATGLPRTSSSSSIASSTRLSLKHEYRHFYKS